MGKFIKHLKVVTKHKRLVRRVCFKIGIPWQGITHDLSKFSFEEFWPSVKNFTDGKASPTVKERETIGYSKAWMHHKGRNKHHLEYWFDINPSTHKYEPVKMPTKYLKEMFADRIAASKVYMGKSYTDGSPLMYLTSHDAKLLMHKETYETLVIWLTVLKDKGEKEAFKYLKKIKKY